MTSPSFQYDFSLWYCLEDDDIATAIREMLVAYGFHGYVEHQDHVAGKPVLASVNEIIQSSRLAIVLLTSHSMTDPWCQRILEWNLVHTVHQKGAKVIPVYVDVTPEQMPPTLRHLTGLKYRERFFKKRLLDSLKKTRAPCCPSTTG